MQKDKILACSAMWPDVRNVQVNVCFTETVCVDAATKIAKEKMGWLKSPAPETEWIDVTVPRLRAQARHIVQALLKPSPPAWVRRLFGEAGSGEAGAAEDEDDDARHGTKRTADGNKPPAAVPKTSSSSHVDLFYGREAPYAWRAWPGTTDAAAFERTVDYVNDRVGKGHAGCLNIE